MRLSPAIARLVDALRQLPGVGPKSAQRMALFLLERNRRAAANLADALQNALATVRRCRQCRLLCENELCEICAHSERDHSLLCVVESPADVFAIEQSGAFRGVYFVLSGRLSPLDGIGPEQLGLVDLQARLANGGINELILATSATLEGEATAFYLSEMANEAGITATRIAQGVPIGGELEQVDSHTLSLALAGRKRL
ncbi:Recombinational DNA repair protein (RecF pathway) [gamma proteobacterium HdN1]|nr:Recombinational DNA repair protein (RecF pathway) [gamma proteobacterium HdN1]